MKVGDVIVCKNTDELINTMQILANEGIDTDFDYTDVLHPALVVTYIARRTERGKG